jgi:hypothetical protein
VPVAGDGAGGMPGQKAAGGCVVRAAAAAAMVNTGYVGLLCAHVFQAANTCYALLTCHIFNTAVHCDTVAAAVTRAAQLAI